MKWFLGVAVAAGALLAVGYFLPNGQSQPVAKADPAVKASHTLTATGSGTVKVNADAARITMKIEASGGDMKSARKVLEVQTRKLKDALETLKLGVEIKPLPIEIARQDFGVGFGGGGFAPPAAPMPVAPPAIQINPLPQIGPLPALPANPPVPAPAPRGVDDNYISAPLPDRGKAPAPDRGPAPPVNDPAVPPQPPVQGGIGIGQPPIGGPGFHLTQGFVVTIKNNDGAKLIDSVNSLLLAAAEAGVQLPGPNNSPFVPGGAFRGGGFSFGGAFGGNVPNQSGPRVVLFRADDRESRRKALELAVADAMANAKAMAKGGDVKIVDTVAISDPPATSAGHPVFDGLGAPPADASTGEIDLTVKVTVTCSY